MAAEREVKVKLVADTQEYIAAVDRAAKRTRKLVKALRELEAIEIRVQVVRDRD